VPLADLEFEVIDSVVIAHVDGEIDMSNADELGNAFSLRLTNDALGLVVDLRKVEYLDSAGIHLIYALRERLDSRGQQLRLVVDGAAAISEALRLAGVSRTVGSFETVDAARQTIAG
jgi:anti-sigma B factor antagonist